MEDQSIELPFSGTDIEQNALSYAIKMTPERAYVQFRGSEFHTRNA